MDTTDLAIWFALCLVLLCSLYWYLTYPYSYWKRYGIPSVPAVPLFGSVLPMSRKPIHEVDMEWYRKYGPLFGHYEGRNPILSVGDPELLKNILVKDFQFFVNRRDLTTGDQVVDNMVSALTGERWKRVRNLMTPAFTTGKIKKMTSMILDCAKKACQNFEKSAKTGEPEDARRFFGAFSMDVIAYTAFATKVDSHNDPDNKFVTMAKKTFGTPSAFRAMLFFFFPAVLKLFRIPIFAKEVMDFFKDVTVHVIEERKRTGQTRTDLLQLMMEAAGMVPTSKGEKEDRNEEDGQPEPKVIPTDQKRMSYDELVAQCVVSFMAGYDTTGSTLSFAAYLLALNPDVQERLIEEIDTVLLEHKGDLSYEAVQSMKYLDNIISETLRLYPTVIRLERRAVDNYELGNTGFTIPKDMIVGIPIFAIQHDPEFFPEPEKFDPDRFTAEAKAERNPYTYLPFGAGPRNCLGMRFALMQVKICLSYLFSQIRLKTCPETKIPLEYTAGQGLLQPKGIILSAELRTDKVCV